MYPEDVKLQARDLACLQAQRVNCQSCAWSHKLTGHTPKFSIIGPTRRPNEANESSDIRNLMKTKTEVFGSHYIRSGKQGT